MKEEMKDEGEKMQEIVSQVFNGEFEDNLITTFTYEDRPCWIAKDIGRVLEYANDGSRLVKNITHDWSREFKRNEDYIILDGKKLKLFKEFIKTGTESVPVLKGSKAMLLFESGMYQVCQKTDKPVGERLRRFLTDEILPKLARGQNIIVNENAERNDVYIIPKDKLSLEAIEIIRDQIQRAQIAEVERDNAIVLVKEKTEKVLRLEGKIEEDKEYVNLAKAYEAEGSIKLSKFVHEGDGIGRLKYTFGEKIIYEYCKYHEIIKLGSMNGKLKWLSRRRYRDWFAMVRDPIAKKGFELHVTGYGQRKLVNFILNDPDAKYWSREKGSAAARRKYLRRNKDNQLLLIDSDKKMKDNELEFVI